MNVCQKFRSPFIVTSLFMLVVFSGVVAAAQTKLEGIIKGRSGPQIFLQTSDSPKVVVLLNDDTDVAQFEGVFKARKKEMSMAALIPGLPIQVEGEFDSQQQLVAKKIRFKGNDLEQAQAIQAGLHETSAQTQQNSEELAKQNAELEKQNAELAKQNADIQAAVARFGQLDDYYILDEVTVYFENGKVVVDPKYNAQLTALAEKAKNVNGYMVQVKGYASTSGSAELNQKLSQDRANNVSTILIQQGHVPLTNMLAPGAMGETEQVESDNATDTEAANRRVVVRVLQNKGIAGAKSGT
ncbi:MAG TPA: OmpA family protein [Terracidiphilus sp.]|nr:OmpA family protein [Terracidiphilus sp.]